MTYTFPRPQALREIADKLGLQLDESEVAEYHAHLDQLTSALRQLETLPELPRRVKYPRDPGYRPEGDENPHNAWYWKTRIRGASSGKLHGKTVAIKDSICVAGVPMSNGASIVEGYVPDIDATAVTRVLDAGGEILGKAACEYFCSAGNSATCSSGPLIIPTCLAIPRADPVTAAPLCWRQMRSTWRSAQIKQGQFGYPRHFAAWLG